MSNTAIRVENVSKKYRLGQIGTGSVSHDLNRWWAKVRGKEDPYSKVGDVNDRTVVGDNDYAWALKDINFEVKQGEVLGIIGRNGAGKSTLLKILSKITTPSEGIIKARGRIASLLEVGTGFHPEMTGRENIYMNGTIMGMTKYEIDRKLDEIIEFAGIAKYIDTPAKRYSSGMAVRLGFAIAAHLEPEILIVDEVLAVGDAEFQKKAIGKMQDVSRGEGRTVLFVSHNMESIKKLCTKGVLLENGQVKSNGEINDIINNYLETYHNKNATILKKGGQVQVSSFTIKNKFNELIAGDDLHIEFTIHYMKDVNKGHIGLNIKNTYNDIFTHVTNEDIDLSLNGKKGDIHTLSVVIPNISFTPGEYYIDIAYLEFSDFYFNIENIERFTVSKGDFIKRHGKFPSHVKIMSKSKWKIQ